MLVSDFDFELPPALIAQEPVERGTSRLLLVDRASGAVSHRTVADLPVLLRRGDLLVVNDSRVFPARLLGRRVPSGGAIECLLIARLDDDRWEALVHPGQKLKPGARFRVGDTGAAIDGEILERRFFGRRVVRLSSEEGPVDPLIDRLGHVPLPPYIKRPDTARDRDRYQTVFARVRGSVAAPTAGLHFTPSLLAGLDAAGIEQTAITLHVGYGTFKPVRTDRVEDHVVDPERYTIGDDGAQAINRALDAGRRIVAVGTTTTRALEDAIRRTGGAVEAGTHDTSLFIYPGFTFRAVGALLTNFHLPRSSLLMLVSAFAGRDRVLAAYREAVARKYRFYSYGDAMLIR